MKIGRFNHSKSIINYIRLPSSFVQITPPDDKIRIVSEPIGRSPNERLANVSLQMGELKNLSSNSAYLAGSLDITGLDGQ